MSLRGVVHGCTIELEEDPHLPDGTTVEVELAVSSQAQNPFWGLWHDYADLLTEMEQEVMSERERTAWRPADGKGTD